MDRAGLPGTSSALSSEGSGCFMMSLILQNADEWITREANRFCFGPAARLPALKKTAPIGRCRARIRIRELDADMPSVGTHTSPAE